MSNTLLIWDDNKTYTQKLCDELGIFYESDVIQSFDALQKNNFVAGKDAIIVLLDTNIDSKKRTEFWGLNIIKYLRKEIRFKGLIVAYSSYEENYFKEMKNSEILFTSGTRLKHFTKKGIDGNEIEKLISSVPKLSNELLDDIAFSAFDSKGKIHEHLHNLKNDLNVIDSKGTLQTITKTIASLFASNKKLLLREIDPQKIIDFNKVFDILQKETLSDLKEHWEKKKGKENFSYTNAGNQINKYSIQIAELAPVSSDDSTNLEEEKIYWEVLFFDDKKDVREIVAGYFKSKNVVCHLAATEEEVYLKLKGNSPKISLFLSDIRLLDAGGNWCDRQGYDVIEQVNKMNDYPLVYSVLTSKKGTINKMVQKKRKYEILWFTKDDVINNSHSFNIFFDMIKRYADENFDSNTVFQPEYGYWEKSYVPQFCFPLKVYYKHYKESKEYPIREKTINQNTMEWLEGKGTKQEWGMHLMQPKINESEIRRFSESKLLARRIALALCAEGITTSGQEIYNRLKGLSETKQGTVKTFFSLLALAPNVDKHINQARDFFNGELIKPGILYEEYEFLRREFFEEIKDTYGLEIEIDGLKIFLKQIERVLISNKIPEPNSFIRVNTILENDGFPKIERMDLMFEELNEIVSQTKSNIWNEVSKHRFLSTVSNEAIKELLRKYEWR